jgi:hypothetical protein
MKRRDRKAEPDDPKLLGALGIVPGDRVRFRRRAGGRWHEGTVFRLEQDGSIGLHDADGRARALPAEVVEVRTEGARGAVRWEPVTERARRNQQLGLWR